MHPLGPANPERVPLNRLFPEAYEETKKQILRDYAFFGGYIVAGVVLVAAIGNIL